MLNIFVVQKRHLKEVRAGILGFSGRARLGSLCNEGRLRPCSLLPMPETRAVVEVFTGGREVRT